MEKFFFLLSLNIFFSYTFFCVIEKNKIRCEEDFLRLRFVYFKPLLMSQALTSSIKFKNLVSSNIS